MGRDGDHLPDCEWGPTCSRQWRRMSSRRRAAHRRPTTSRYSGATYGFAGRVSGNAHCAHHRLLDVSLPVQSSSSPEVATVSHSRIGNWLCPCPCWHLLSSTGLCRPDPPVWECSATVSSPPLAGSTAAPVRYPKAAQGCYIRLDDSPPIAPARKTSIVRSTASAVFKDSRS